MPMSKPYNPGHVTFFSDRPKSPMKDLDPLDLSYPKFQGDLDLRVDMFEYAPPGAAYDQMGFAALPELLALHAPMSGATLSGQGPISSAPMSAGGALPAYNGYASPLLNVMPVKREWDENVRAPPELKREWAPDARDKADARDWDDGAPELRVAKERPRIKSAHNVIEQRYRNKINDKFTALQNLVPTLRVLARKKPKTKSDDEDDDDEYDYSPDAASPEDLEGLEPARKLNKGTILTKSVEYIKFLERKNDRMKAEWRELVERARMLGVLLDETLLDPPYD